MSSTTTHSTDLLATNQPWNLILFRAILVIFAEFIAVTELPILFQHTTGDTLKRLNGYAGIFVGLYFLGVLLAIASRNAPAPRPSSMLRPLRMSSEAAALASIAGGRSRRLATSGNSRTRWSARR
jgi:hypothetical protein